jgi:hypothetical protein
MSGAGCEFVTYQMPLRPRSGLGAQEVMASFGSDPTGDSAAWRCVETGSSSGRLKCRVRTA